MHCEHENAVLLKTFHEMNQSFAIVICTDCKQMKIEISAFIGVFTTEWVSLKYKG